MNHVFNQLRLLLLLFFSFTLSAQHNDNIWLMSDINGGVEINFSTGEPVVTPIQVPIMFENASATINNTAGELQFYTNGCYIYNHAHALMENGDNINPGYIHDNWCGPSRGYPTGLQSCVGLPWPDRENEYLLFHKPGRFDFDSIENITDHYNPLLLYSHVDMNENNGLGRVIDKNVLIAEDRFESGAIAANRHANGNDWWIISPLEDTNLFIICLLDSSGVVVTSYQQLGQVDNPQTNGGGQSVFSHRGDKYFRFHMHLGLEIADFDRTTGLLSNYRYYPFPVADHFGLGFGGMGVSPNDRFVYVSNTRKVWQYDLEAPDIGASRQLIGEALNPTGLFVPPSAWNFQLGPDCKLYSYYNSGDAHNVIHFPNEPGLDCQWEQAGLQLPYPVFRDQPYFPNFRLGPVGAEGSPCAEPLVSTTDEVDEVPPVYLTVYPNPATGPVALSTTGVLRGNAYYWRLYDLQGRLLEAVQVVPGENMRLERGGRAAGAYVWQLAGQEGVLQSGKLVWE